MAERSIKVLAPLLHAGDILLWEHHEGSERGPHASGRSGGHTQTIASIDRSGTQLKEIDVLQGNQPLPADTGENLRYTPGRRIEIHRFTSFEDVTLPVTGSKPPKTEQVWRYGDGLTTLTLAGPPKSGQRPAAKKEHGKTVRHLADWLPAIAAARRDRLAGVFEAAMREAQAMLERGNVLRSGQGSTNPTVVAQVFMAVSAAFEGTVPQPGWSGGEGGRSQRR